MSANYISNIPEGKDFFEGKSQNLVAKAIYDTIKSCSNLPHIIGLEGDWGSGKSNVIKQLRMLDNFDKDYYLFTYDAWGHQEDLQRRSILEVLTTELIKNEFLVGNGKVSLRNGEVKEDKWSSLLSYLLSNKTVTTIKPTVRITSFTLWMVFVMVVYSATSYICIKGVLGEDCYYPLVFAIPYILGAVIIAFYALKDCSFNFLKQYVSKTNAEQVTEEYVSSEEPSIQEFRNWMQAISNYIGSNHKQKLVLVFDNMDRLASEKVKQLWSSIYAFFAAETFENIWVVIPYDEKHLISTFSEGDQNNGDNFIKKTFSMVYRVSPPIISDYELLFNSYFEEAFGKDKDENRISQIFRVLNPNPNPRDVIYFLNQMVSLVRIWDDSIPLADIALYVCRKVNHHRKNKTLDEYLLSNDVFEDVEALFVHHEKTKVNIAKLAYGLNDDELAQQIPMRNYLRSFFEKDGNQDINEFVDNSHFVTVLTDVINDALPTLVNKYIVGLGKLDDSKLSEVDKDNIRHKWDSLVNKWEKSPINKQNIGDEPKLLLLHCSPKYKYRLVENIVYKLQHFSEFNGKDYFFAMDELRQFLKVNSIEYDFSTSDWVNTSAEIFWNYLYVAKEQYIDFKVTTSNDELVAYLSDSNFSTCKWPNLIENLVNDLRYNFKPLHEFCQRLIEADEVSKENVCTLLYFVSFIQYRINGQFTLTKNLPKAEVINSLYSDIYGSEEYQRKDGYWDFVFLAMILAGQTPTVADENMDELAKVSVKYMRFNDIFVNLDSVYSVRQELAKKIIEQKLIGNLKFSSKIKDLPIIQSVTALPWNEILEYFSAYVNNLLEDEKIEIKKDFTTFVPSALLSNIKTSNSQLVKTIVNLGRNCLETREHQLFDSSGNVVGGYWKQFVMCFLGTETWGKTDGFVLEELRTVFDLYCDNQNFSLINNEFVDFLLDHTNQSDLIPIMYKVRNGFSVGNREANIDVFKYFVSYFPAIEEEIQNKETFVQNFIEYAFIHDVICRTLVFKYSKFYMPLINDSYRIAKGIIDYINSHKDSEEVCQNLYECLSNDVKELLKSQENEDK